MTRLINSRKKKINKKISRNKRNYIGSGNMETYLDKFLNSDDNFLNESEKYVKRFITQVMSNRQETVNCIAEYSKDCRNINLAVKRLYTNPLLKKNIKNVFKILSESYNEDITLNDILYNVGESAKIYADSDSVNVNLFLEFHLKALEGLDEELIDHNQVMGLFIFLAFTDMYYISIAMENNLILNGGTNAVATQGSSGFLSEFDQKIRLHRDTVPQQSYTITEKALIASGSIGTTVGGGVGMFFACGPLCAVGGAVGGALVSLAATNTYNENRFQEYLEMHARKILYGEACPIGWESVYDTMTQSNFCKKYGNDANGIRVPVNECQKLPADGINDSCATLFQNCVLEGDKKGIVVGEKCYQPSKLAPGTIDFLTPKPNKDFFSMGYEELRAVVQKAADL
jgi:hypothetical protein